jgi:hypothetical protein
MLDVKSRVLELHAAILANQATKVSDRPIKLNINDNFYAFKVTFSHYCSMTEFRLLFLIEQRLPASLHQCIFGILFLWLRWPIVRFWHLAFLPLLA